MEFKSAKNTIWVPHPGSQVHFLRCPADEALLHGNRGGGKAQPLDSMVLTPRGFRRMGDLEIGNKVCNPDGTISTIIGVYPQGKKKIYKVIFHDGSVVRCCGEHLWFGKIIIANTPIEHISNFSEEEFKGINFPSATIQSTININRFYVGSYYGLVIPGINGKPLKIVAIVENGEEEVQCIKVNNPNGLYITDDFVVTHNTDCLLMDFLQHVGVGYGMEWRGVLFREEYTQLTDVINKSKKWISQIFPGAKYNGSEHKWTFPEGETLYLRYMRVPGDYWAYHGHEYPWIGWEELTNWATDECYLAMMSCNRCSDPDVPRKYRSTCNPSGPGHSWVKHRFIEPIPPLKILKDPNSGKTRAHINSKLEENKTFLDADPRYQQTIIEATKDDPAKYKAWVLGSWDIVTGGFFYDVWDRDIHVLPYFQIPASWRFYRSFDWGSTKPWAVTYIAESNGEQPIGYPNLPYFPTGTAVVFQELYGWNGKPNEGDPEKATSYEIADRVLGMDRAIEREFRAKVFPGPADNSIYDVRDGASIGSTMRTFGLHWRPSYKGPGSRISGWALIRTMLGAAKRKDLENPHLYFCEPARHHIRTLPLMQHDKGKPEDIDTNLEDHCFVGNTLVSTEHGPRFIDNLVGTEGFVLGVNGKLYGYRNCRLTRREAKVIRVSFADNTSVECTPDHYFLTNNGWIQAKDLLTHSDIQCIVSLKSISEGILWKKLRYYQKLSRNFLEKCTTYAVGFLKNVAYTSTELFGNTIMGLFPKGFTSIIKKQGTITRSKICNYFQQHNTLHCIIQGTVGPSPQLLWKKQRNGTAVETGWNGTRNTTKIPKKPFTKKLVENAVFVVKMSPLYVKIRMLFALINANLHIDGHRALTPLKKSVKYVVPPTSQTNILENTQKPVHVSAVSNLGLKVRSVEELYSRKDVYCLEVARVHSFCLGNGVVVSNCMDSLRYGLAKKLTAVHHKSVRY